MHNSSELLGFIQNATLTLPGGDNLDLGWRDLGPMLGSSLAQALATIKFVQRPQSGLRIISVIDFFSMSNFNN